MVHRHEDPTFWFKRLNISGIPEIMFCRILMFMWSLGLLGLLFRVAASGLQQATGSFLATDIILKYI